MASQSSDISKDAVLAPSQTLPKDTPTVTGYDFNDGVDHHKLFKSFKYSGFQATSFGCGVEEINKMIECREKPLPVQDSTSIEDDEFTKIKRNCTIFLGYTSNMVSCGVRETIRFLVEHSMVDCIVTTAGGVEEDMIKCLAPTFIGDWSMKGTELRPKGLNRIGNLIVPNNNYCLFEDWVMPLLDEMLEEQKSKNIIWSPSRIITRLGERINDPSSIAYWAAKNKIPIFSPALTDGSLGDMMYFHGIKNPGLIVDINSDLRRLNDFAKRSLNTGMIIVGGGLIKHHICNANLMRNGANFSVFLNTSSEYDGSDSGARPDEAISWGKIRMDATPVKIYGESSFFFPLLVAETFARRHFESTAETQRKESP
ncbi:UNVERIFIED_CONTAM: hypothetical protein GTU68_030057 [Idotea baltica]|nr:hypothetical protein [Idotea baltica]